MAARALLGALQRAAGACEGGEDSDGEDKHGAANTRANLFAVCDEVRAALAGEGLLLDDPCACGRRGGAVAVVQ